MKKFIFALTMLMGVLTIFTVTNVNASVEVEINESTFPDNYIRDYLGRVVDTNQDGVLQQDEINRVERIYIDYDAEDRTDSLFSDKINCKGLEIFTNVKEFHVVPHGTANSNIYNLNVIYSMPKLEELHIFFWKAENVELDLSIFPNLKKLYLGGINKLNKINLSKNKKLTEFHVTSVTGNAVINLSKLKNLENFSCSFINVKGLKFGKLKKITSLELSPSQGSRNAIKKLDLSGLKNLHTLSISNFQKLNTLKLGRNKKIEDISIFNCKKLKKINLSRCKNLYSVWIFNSGLKKLVLNKDNMIDTLMLSDNKLKRIKLMGKYLERVMLEDNKLKKVDISKLKNLSYIRLDKKTKIIMTKKQKRQVKVVRNKKKN